MHDTIMRYGQYVGFDDEFTSHDWYATFTVRKKRTKTPAKIRQQRDVKERLARLVRKAKRTAKYRGFTP